MRSTSGFVRKTLLTALVLALLAPLASAQCNNPLWKFQNLDLSCVNGTVEVTVIGGEIVLIVTHTNRQPSTYKWDVWGTLNDSAGYSPAISMTTLAYASWDSRPCAVGNRSMVVVGPNGFKGVPAYTAGDWWVTASFGFNVWTTPLSRIANGIGAYSTPQDLAFSYCDAGYCWPGCTGSQLNADGPEMAAAAFILSIK